MTDVNKVVLIGRLSRDIGGRDYGFTPGGTARLCFSIAVNRREKDGEEWADKPSFFDVTYWGKQAEGIRPYLTKGRQVAVCGRLEQRKWEKDGKTFSKVAVVAEGVQLLGGHDGGAQTQGQGYAKGFADGASEGGSLDFAEDVPF